MIQTNEIELLTKGKGEVIDITAQIDQKIKQSGIDEGQVVIFVVGSTGAVATLEYEPGLVKDLPEMMEKLIPADKPYHHHLTWHDGNGHSHLRATLIGPCLTIPVFQGQAMLGTWQQVIFIEFDIKPHQRRIIIQINGE